MGCGCGPSVETVCWLGLDWLGMPFPVRWLAWLVYLYRGGSDHFTEFQAARWKNCGCLAAVKKWLILITEPETT